jgi:hypothetical protein
MDLLLNLFIHLQFTTKFIKIRSKDTKLKSIKKIKKRPKINHQASLCVAIGTLFPEGCIRYTCLK